MKKSLYEYAIKHAMNRRSFVKGAASAGAIAAMSGGLSSVASSAKRSQTQSTQSFREGIISHM